MNRSDAHGAESRNRDRASARRFEPVELERACRRRTTGGVQTGSMRGGNKQTNARERQLRRSTPIDRGTKKTTGAPTPIVSPLRADSSCVEITRIAANELTPI